MTRCPSLIAERDRLAAALSASSVVFASGGNFLLFRHTQPQALLDALAEREIVLRDFRTLPGCEGCLRISVGTPDENDVFIDVLNTVVH